MLESALDTVAGKVRRTIERYGDFFPMYTRAGRWVRDGEKWTDWCGGFFAGQMWLLYRHTGDEAWRRHAEHYSRLLESRKDDGSVHDLGFIFLNTYLPWYELRRAEPGAAAAPGGTAGSPRSPASQRSRASEQAATETAEHLNQVLIHAGRTLAGRFQERGGYLASFIGPESLFIDIMMNVPLVFYAARESGDERLREIALAHCRTTQQYLVRPDGSTAHEGLFDTASGRFLRQSTHQGYSSESCWSRGLAWALYGFGTAYAYTGEREFLETAVRCADYYLAHTPAGGVPPWDFDAPGGAAPEGPPDQVLWDSSAAAIAASGLLNLSEFVEGMAEAYRRAAGEIVETLGSAEFLAAADPDWEGVLMHGVYHVHKGLGVDESVVWGDFFFTEAVAKLMARGEARNQLG